MMSFVCFFFLVAAGGAGSLPLDQVERLVWTDPMGREPVSHAEWTAARDRVQGAEGSRVLGFGAVGTVPPCGDSPGLRYPRGQSPFGIPGDSPFRAYDDVVNVVVHAELYPFITAELARYQADLVAAGYAVQVDTTRGTSHEALRSHLAGVSNIVGAVLVGDLPLAWYEMSGEEFPCDLYLMDLDGIWHDNDGDGLYDDHSGSMAADIWVGRLDARPLTWDDEVRLMKHYFDKNHAYRTGSLSLPDRGLAYVDDDWDYFGNCDLDEVYTSVTTVTDTIVTRASDYRQRLEQGYEWIQICAHSSPWGHTFKMGTPYGGTVFNSDIYGIRPHAHFYNLFACSGTRYVEENCSAGWDIFQDDYGLLAVGSAKSGSMLYFDDFYRPMGQGECIGEAFRLWFAQWAEEDRYWFYAMNILGDPTLKPHGNGEGSRVQGVEGSRGEGPPVDAETVCTHTETDDSPGLLCMEDGDVWAIWKSGRSTQNGRFDIYASVRESGTWSSAYSIGPHKYWDTDPVLGLDGSGRPVAVWAGYTDYDHWFDLFYSTWSGTGWSARQRISINVAADLNPTLTRDSTGTLWCFWSSRRDLFSDIFVSSYNGSTWSTPVNLTSDSMEVIYPQAATMPDGTVWVTYTRYRDGAAEVWAAYRDGPSWVETGPVSGTQRREYRPAIAWGPGNVPLVCWQSFETGNGDICCSEYNHPNWTTPMPVDSDSGMDVMPVMATDVEGTPWVCWMSDRNGNWDIYYSHLGPVDWIPAQPVEQAPGPDMNPAIAAGLTGDMWVVWQNLFAGNWDIYAKSVPLSGCVAEPGRGVAAVAVGPNPFHELLLLQFGTGVRGATVTDVSGRVVRRLVVRAGRAEWRGLDDYGCKVRPGVYFVREEGSRVLGFKGSSRKVILTR